MQNIPDIQREHAFVDHSLLIHANRELLKKPQALLVGLIHPNMLRAEVQEHIDELALLAETHHIPVVGTFITTMRSRSSKTYVTKGKLTELMAEVQANDATVVIFDDEITPGQQRNLEDILQVPVMDRTEVILGVFFDRAKSHESKLQVELAQIQYVYPRLKRMWTHLSRQRGGGGGASGGGYLKGAGEKQIEIDRRILKRKMSQLRKEITHVQKYRTTQRQQRLDADIPIFSLVGYTNAGKSTLLNALTDADAYVEDKLFATLDTTTRRYTFDSNQEVLVIDTVGFIRKLPHALVAAFKSTLEETTTAECLIHVVDVTHPVADEQAAITLQVLKELGCKDTPIITVLNKVDQLAECAPSQQNIVSKLKVQHPRAVMLSAKTKEGLDELLSEMKRQIAHRKKTLVLRIPQSNYNMVSKAHKVGKVLEQDYEENDVILKVEVPSSAVASFSSYVAK